ncbi:hypothetical protein BJ508DRAFT_379204 [Ascobolus immersus RN42]|uniref:Extracellular membrane protein CFEM domain-containing protein n=1 Tax=Ascobolus immersus RN42 TaxID=1160509 RepID=A0A3N4HSS4_ASCIM|nr:hypothetical protein BJ508DRAFT_379204 [Ascobolus immersus RN42]
MKLSSALPLFALPLLVAAADNTTTPVDVPEFTKLTDLDSLISNFNTCHQGACLRTYFLSLFNAENLSSCKKVTGQKNETIDWRCICGVGVEETQPTKEQNTTLETITADFFPCVNKEMAVVPECNAKTKEELNSDMIARLDKLSGYCNATFKTDDSTSKDGGKDTGKNDPTSGAKSDSNSDNKADTKTSGSIAITVNSIGRIAFVGVVGMLAFLV